MLARDELFLPRIADASLEKCSNYSSPLTSRLLVTTTRRKTTQSNRVVTGKTETEWKTVSFCKDLAWKKTSSALSWGSSYCGTKVEVRHNHARSVLSLIYARAFVWVGGVREAALLQPDSDFDLISWLKSKIPRHRAYRNRVLFRKLGSQLYDPGFTHSF